MKKSYQEMPESLKGTYGEFSRAFGFCWKEFVMTVPSPMFLVTTYKSNGEPNACMQSWAAFTSANKGNGFYAILGSVNKSGHLYQSLQEKKEAVINFFSENLYDACMATIRNNQFDADEITASGLTAEKAKWVDAPYVSECFMNLECRYCWEKEIAPDDDHVMICLEVVGAHIDEDALADKTGDAGLVYYAHYPMNPEKVAEKACDYVAVLQKKRASYEY